MNSGNENAGATGGDLPVMISIPLAQRERPISWSGKILTKLRSFRPKPIDLSTPEWERRRELLQALAVGIAINAFLVLLLMFVLVADSPEEPDHSIQVAFPTDAVDEDVSLKQSGAAAARTLVESKAPPPKKLATTTALNDLFVELTVDPAMGEIGYDPAAMTLDFGSSLTAEDFRAARNGFAYNKNGTGSRGRGSSGLGHATIAGLFSNPGLGNGSKMVLFVDISGSMESVSQEVRRYVSTRFPQSVSTQIQGCSFRGANSPVIQAFRNQQFRKERDQYYFICDLHDGANKEGLNALRAILYNPKGPKELHVVSFSKEPVPGLRELIKGSGGTVTLMTK